MANRLLKRVRDFAEVKYHAEITKEVADFALDILNVDKIGLDNVKAELLEKGVGEAAIAVVEPVLTLSGSNQEK